MGVRICPQCLGKVAESRNDCPHCGYNFLKKKKCKECEEFVDINVIECPICGYFFETPVRKEEEEVEKTKQIVLEHSLLRFNKNITKEEFLRMALIELTKNPDCPSDILSAKIGDIVEGEAECIYAKCLTSGTYSGTIGYNRQEEYVVQEYGFVGSNQHYTLNGQPRVGTGEKVMRDVKKTRTVTDWMQHSGVIDNETFSVTYTKDYSTFEYKFKNLFSKEDLSSLYKVEKDTASLGTENIDKGKELLTNEIYNSITWPGDHVKDKIHRLKTTEYEFYRCVVPTYTLTYEYEGKTFKVEGLAISGISPVVYSPSSTNSNSIKRIEIVEYVKVNQKEKLINIIKVMAIILLIAGIFGFVFTSGSPAFVPILVGFSGALLLCLRFFIYGCASISSIKKKYEKQKQILSNLKNILLIKELEKRHLPKLTRSEEYELKCYDMDINELNVSKLTEFVTFSEEEKKAWTEITPFEYEYKDNVKNIRKILLKYGLLGAVAFDRIDEVTNVTQSQKVHIVNICSIIIALISHILGLIFINFQWVYNIKFYDFLIRGYYDPLIRTTVIVLIIYFIAIVLNLIICIKNIGKYNIVSSLITLLFGISSIVLTVWVGMLHKFEKTIFIVIGVSVLFQLISTLLVCFFIKNRENRKTDNTQSQNVHIVNICSIITLICHILGLFLVNLVHIKRNDGSYIYLIHGSSPLLIVTLIVLFIYCIAIVLNLIVCVKKIGKYSIASSLITLSFGIASIVLIICFIKVNIDLFHPEYIIFIFISTFLIMLSVLFQLIPTLLICFFIKNRENKKTVNTQSQNVHIVNICIILLSIFYFVLELILMVGDNVYIWLPRSPEGKYVLLFLIAYFIAIAIESIIYIKKHTNFNFVLTGITFFLGMFLLYTYWKFMYSDYQMYFVVKNFVLILLSVLFQLISTLLACVSLKRKTK